MSFERTFAAMRAIVERPGYPYLKHYRDDFYEIDREYLQKSYHDDAKYLWIVRDYGTHLASVGVHPKMYQDSQWELKDCNRIDLFLVYRCRVRPISCDRAKKLMAKFHYSIKGDVVAKRRRAMARIELTISWSAKLCTNVASVRFSSLDVVQPMQDGDLIALLRIAPLEVWRRSKSPWTGIGSIWLDGADLGALIDARRRGRLHAQVPQLSLDL